MQGHVLAAAEEWVTPERMQAWSPIVDSQYRSDRQAGDATIKLSEVEITGRPGAVDDRAAAAGPQVYFDGTPPAPVTATGTEDADWYYLEGGGLRVAVSRATGALGPIFNKARRCTMLSSDVYHVETREGADEFSEGDNVVATARAAGNVLKLTCRNANMADVDIVQTYRVTPDGIAKITELVNRGDLPDLFVTVKTATILDEQFRKPGWYLGADHGLGGRLKTSDVTMPMTATCHAPENTKVAILMNYDEGFGIAQHRYAMNGEYCAPIATARYVERSNHAPLYTPNGWEMGLVTLHLEPGRSRSVEVRWSLFPEDEFFFLKQYTDMPEVNEHFAVERPDWLLRLKTIAIRGNYPLGEGANRDLVVQRVKQSIDLYDDGCLYLLLCADDVWGDWYQGDRYGSGWCGEKVDNDAMRDLIAALHARTPSLKLGVYTWAWTGWTHSQTYREHPDWYIPRNKDGYLKKAYQNGPMNVVRRISGP